MANKHQSYKLNMGFHVKKYTKTKKTEKYKQHKRDDENKKREKRNQFFLQLNN